MKPLDDEPFFIVSQAISRSKGPSQARRSARRQRPMSSNAVPTFDLAQAERARIPAVARWKAIKTAKANGNRPFNKLSSRGDNSQVLDHDDDRLAG